MDGVVTVYTLFDADALTQSKDDASHDIQENTC